MSSGVARRCRRPVSLHVDYLVRLLYRCMYALACDNHRCSMHTTYSSLCVSRLTSAFPELSLSSKGTRRCRRLVGRLCNIVRSLNLFYCIHPVSALSMTHVDQCADLLL